MWTRSGNYHNLVLAEGAITIRVCWVDRDGGGYTVQVNKIQADKLFVGREEAKQAGIDLARRLMQDATHELNLLRMQTPVTGLHMAVLR